MESRSKSTVLQPLFDFDHLNIPLIVLKHRVPHLFSSRRNPRRSKRISYMSAQSRLDRSVDDGRSRNLTATCARVIAGDIARVRTEILDSNLSTSSPDHSSSATPISKSTDLCLTLMLAEQLSASATIKSGTEEWATRWQTVFAKIKEIYANILPPLRSDFEGPVDNRRIAFDTDIGKWIRDQVPVYVSYLRRFPIIIAQAVPLVESLQNAYNVLRTRESSTPDQQEQVCVLVATILEAMQLDMLVTDVSVSVDTAGMDIFGLAQIEKLLENDPNAFVEELSSVFDDSDSMETGTPPSNVEILRALFAGASQATGDYDEHGFTISEESVDVGSLRGREPVNVSSPRGRHDESIASMELTDDSPGRILKLVSPPLPPEAPTISPSTPVAGSPVLGASVSPAQDPPSTASGRSSPARSAANAPSRSASPRLRASPGTEVRGAGAARPLGASTPQGDSRRRASGKSVGSQDSDSVRSFGRAPSIQGHDFFQAKIEALTHALKKEQEERARERASADQRFKELKESSDQRLKEVKEVSSQRLEELKESWEREREGMVRERALADQRLQELKESWEREREAMVRERTVMDRERETLMKRA
ncbi:hypothetical protein C8Q78DRAFT_998661 [Trametes maxima]|nr:hypothetical protein C8Q78DRAFT_998661 [Trametes maxima]